MLTLHAVHSILKAFSISTVRPVIFCNRKRYFQGLSDRKIRSFLVGPTVRTGALSIVGLRKRMAVYIRIRFYYSKIWCCETVVNTSMKNWHARTKCWHFEIRYQRKVTKDFSSNRQYFVLSFSELTRVTVSERMLKIGNSCDASRMFSPSNIKGAMSRITRLLS